MASLETSRPRETVQELGPRLLLFLVAFVCLKAVSAWFVFPPQENSAIWLPSGLTVAVLLRSRRERWPLWLTVIFLLEAVTVLYYDRHLGLAVVWGVGNVVRTWVAAGLMRRWLELPVTFSRTRDVTGLLLAAGVAGPLFSATLGVGAVALWMGTSNFWADWLSWFLSDGLGGVLVAPVLLTWRAQGMLYLPLRPRQLLELGGLLAVLALVTHLLFGGLLPNTILISLPYVCFPMVLWIAMRQGPFSAALAIGVLGTLAVWHTAAGRGPFGLLPASNQERVLAVQLFLAVVGLSAMVLAAVVCERRRAQCIQRVLADAGAVLAESLEPRITLPRIARLVAPEMATGFVLWLRDEAGHFEPVVQVGLAPGRVEALRETLTRLDGSARRWRSLEGTTVLARLQQGGQVLGGLALVTDGRERPLGPRDLVFAEDLARRCALSLEKARLFKEAQEAIQVRDEFIGIAAHELRTPLTALKLHLQGLMRQVPRGEEANGMMSRLHAVVRQTSRLSRLVESLLDVRRLNTGQLELQREEVNLIELVEEVLERLEGDLERAGCETHVRAESPVLGWFDRIQLEQVLMNLLGNAMKFGARHPIEVEVGWQGDWARISVRDQGIGVAPEELERIFGRFERAVSSREYGGLGLGLFLTKQIVEAHGGTIRVESQPGAGATFTVLLPAPPRPPLYPSAPETAASAPV
jgi:signal transduction histidine kinase/integral membrane sensor domain MASE1